MKTATDDPLRAAPIHKLTREENVLCSSNAPPSALHLFLQEWSFIMLTQPCSLKPICQTPLALSTCLDLDLA
ncbi:unnamed protein product [Pleuronectes platessa]|uniref:Uncharacterized protein n=1 Tax=Pleuronectes platessa TaxID=8262 RepID=A0A9N7TVM5_PLEPL|nr:unnamed protein product [Pleuronectes platessa]